MSDLSGVLLSVLGFAGCVVALSGIILPPLPQRETLTDRWCKLTEELPK